MDYLERRPRSDYHHVWIDNVEDRFLVQDGCVETLLKLLDKTVSNGGELLSRLWTGVDTKVTLECSEGHLWRCTARNVLYGESWCPTCASDGQWKGHKPERPRRSFKQALQMAREQAVQHTGTARNLRQSTTWRCRRGHSWKEPARAILIRGFFCQKCDGRPARLLQTAQRTAIERGGQCLSTDYVNNRTPLRWVCGQGHEWTAPYKRVVTNGTWCLECANLARRKTGSREFSK